MDSYEFWIPLTARGLVNNDGDTRLNIVVRLRPDIAPRQAEAALLPYAQQATAHLPQESRAMSVALHSSATRFGVTFTDLLSGRGAPGAPLLAIFGTFALVLMICCANVANMMLARGLARQREIGVRLSRGASRGRVTRQLLTEGFLIAVLAGLAGILTARVMYGVISYLVNQRTREIGIRMALGATPMSVLQFVVGQSIRMILAGLAVGILLA